jgi:hypothetical protein
MTNNNESNLSDEDALKNFLLDIDCLNPLSEWTSKFNIFDILKITRAEIRHSNVLAWLLSPNENHGLGDRIIRGFIQYLVSENHVSIDVFKTLLMDCSDFEILREWHNIDLLAVSKENKFLICIENKIDSGEHDNQLKRYEKTLEYNLEYKDYNKNFVYLTPEGSESSLPELWISMSYQEVIKIIEKAMKDTKVLPESEMLINNYIESVRRNIVGDEKLRQICNEIYAKHKKALDLIFEYKSDKTSELTDIIRKWAEEKTKNKELSMCQKYSKSYVRFTTDFMSHIMPSVENYSNDWGTSSFYCYEIRNYSGKQFNIKLVLRSDNIPDNLMEVCRNIMSFRHLKEKKDWKCCFPFSTKTKYKNEEEDLQYDEKEINNTLEEMLSDVKKFENELMNYLKDPSKKDTLQNY